MIKITKCCDLCGLPLPTEVVTTPFGDVEHIKTFKSKEWDISSIATDLCELCALKIDVAVLALRKRYLECDVSHEKNQKQNGTSTGKAVI